MSSPLTEQDNLINTMLLITNCDTRFQPHYFEEKT